MQTYTSANTSINNVKLPDKYYFLYWLPNQSKIFSEPYYFGTNNHEELIKNLNKAKEHGYEIEYLKDE